MKRRIDQLLNGIFEYEQGKLTVIPERIELKGVPDTAVQLKFVIEGAREQKVHGFLYSSDPRLSCAPEEFEGITNEIRAQFDCSGLKTGSVCTGFISVCSDCGEYEIPYTVTVEAVSEEMILPFATLEEFTELAKTDYQKAYRYFLTSGFHSFLKDRPSLQSLCEGLRNADVSYRSLEEFLTFAGQKEPLTFSVDTESMDLGILEEPVQEKLTIRKNTWGFQSISLESDALFVRPEKKLFSTDEFAGNSYELPMVIDTNLMHAGINYARLTLCAGRQTMFITVTARHKAEKEGISQNRVCRIMIKEIENFYIKFRLKKIDLTAWVDQSVSAVNSYKRAGGTDPFADLYLIQLYFAGDKKTQAYKILEQVEAHKELLNTPELYGYYLYLTTFFYHQDSYVDQVEEEVSRLFFRDQTSWPLLWILLYLQEKYLDDNESRFEAISEQFSCGCRSRILYVEAWQCLRQDAFLLRHLGEFELHLLRFAAQEDALTAEIVRQSANLAMHYVNYDRRLYCALAKGYSTYPSDDLLKAIVQLLIRGGRKDREAFQWYEKGVENGLRLTGLYEAYMAAMEAVDPREMPQIIRMYFSYDTSLDYRKRAAVYRTVLEHKGSDPQTWDNQRPAIEHFVMEQVQEGHLTDDLAVLYKGILRQDMISQSVAGQLIRLLFTVEIRCELPQIRQIAVHSCRMPGEQFVSLRDGRAQILMPDPDSALLALDKNGHRFDAKDLCTMRRMLDDDTLLVWCSDKLPDDPDLVLYLCVESLREQQMNEQLLPFFVAGCEERKFSAAFRDELRQTVLQYYLDHPRLESKSEFLGKISYEEYAHVNKTAMITLLAEEGDCAEAFSLLENFGAEGISLIQLVRICSRMVLELEFEENQMLISLCHFCFESGKYDDKLLRYLLLYYEGTVEDMKLVWSAACGFDLDTMLLEEKILMMMLFTRCGTEGSEPIFESYLKKMGHMNLCQAYVNLKAYEYFVRGLPVADSVFQFIENRYRRLSGHNRLGEQLEICRLALLQHYANAISLSKTQRVYAQEILGEFIAKGIRFAFFRRFDAEILKPYQLDGHVFAEYVGNPESEVTLYFRYQGTEEEYSCEKITQNFEGIFVREFTLFAGEAIECRFVEDNGQERVRSDKLLLTAEKDAACDFGMYGALNRIYRAARAGDEEKAEEALESWMTMEHLTEEVFTLI